MSRLILASASPRRRELLAQAGFVFEVCPAHIPEEPRPGEDPVGYVTRLAREKAEAVYEMQGTRGGGNKGTREQGNKGTREQGNEGTEGGSGNGELVVLGADTTVTLDGLILEKPRDAEDAARMLRMLSGRTHRVITGVAVVSGFPRGRNAGPSTALGAQSAPNSAQDDSLVFEGDSPSVNAGSGQDVSLVGDASSAQDASVVLEDDGLGPDGIEMRVEVAAEVTAVRFLTLSEEEIAAYVASGEPMDKAGAYAIQGLAAKWIPRIEGCYFNVVGLPLALVAQMVRDRDGLQG